MILHTESAQSQRKDFIPMSDNVIYLIVISEHDAEEERDIKRFVS